MILRVSQIGYRDNATRLPHTVVQTRKGVGVGVMIGKQLLTPKSLEVRACGGYFVFCRKSDE